jgi:hypothetical protein
VEIDIPLWLPRPEGMSAVARIYYTGEALFLRISASEKNILARFDGLLDMVCRDSCLEFFFCPHAEDDRYFNFEFNPLGAMYLGFGRDRCSSVRQIREDYRTMFSVDPFRFDGGWGINFSIPASFINLYIPSFSLRSGLIMRGNFYKCGDETKAPHYLAWNPVVSKKPDFHRPESFGTMILV